MAYPPPDGSPRQTPGYQGPYTTPTPRGYQVPQPRPNLPPGVVPQAPSSSPPPESTGGLIGWLGRLLGRRRP